MCTNKNKKRISFDSWNKTLITIRHKRPGLCLPFSTDPPPTPPLLSLLQPHSLCLANVPSVPSVFLPQGLCTYFPLSLECSSPRSSCGLHFSSKVFPCKFYFLNMVSIVAVRAVSGDSSRSRFCGPFSVSCCLCRCLLIRLIS